MVTLRLSPGDKGVITTGQFPGHHDKGVVDSFQSATAAEPVEIGLHRGEEGERLWNLPR